MDALEFRRQESQELERQLILLSRQIDLYKEQLKLAGLNPAPGDGSS